MRNAFEEQLKRLKKHMAFVYLLRLSLENVLTRLLH